MMLTKKDLAKRLGLNLSTIYRRIEAGTIPEPDEMKGKKQLWTEETLKEIIAKDKENIKEVTIKLEQIQELAKTKTTNEIAKIIGETGSKVYHFCIKNKISTQSFKGKKGNFKKETKPIVIMPKGRKQQIFNDVLKIMKRVSNFN